MVGFDEDSLICDLAETYHILNYKEYSLYLVSKLAIGLRNNSRIKMKLSNQRINLETMLLASILDILRLDLWGKTKDGAKKKNKPKSIVKIINNDEDKEKREYITFKSCEDFEKERKKILHSWKGCEV